MTLTKEQKKELGNIGEKLRKIEKIATENNIDLDVFMTDYNEGKHRVYSTEKIKMKQKASERKEIFEKEGKEKAKNFSKKD